MGGSLHNRVRALREGRGLSQAALAERARLSRQSVHAIEAGKATPAVDVALRLARTLGCSVEELFAAAAEEGALPTDTEPGAALRPGRVAVARIGDRFVSYALDGDGVGTAADALVVGAAEGRAVTGRVADRVADRVTVAPLRSAAELVERVVLMGCAPALGMLADRLNSRPGAGRFLWLPRSSTAALAALAARLTHVAGVHLVDPKTGEANLEELRPRAGAEPLVLVTLARWEEGLVARPDDARPIRRAADLARRGLLLVGREPGSGAQRLLERVARQQGLPLERTRRPRLQVRGHLDVARAVLLGAADTGVATRDAALAFGLTFIPLAEERYDLALPRASLADPRVQRLLDVLVSSELRRELEALGYDTRPAGQRAAELVGA